MATLKQVNLDPVSWPRMIRAVEKVRERLTRAVRALEGAGIPYALAGGHAVAAWVSRVDESAVRTTRDVDVLLRPADLDMAKAALALAGFVHRRVTGLGMPGGMDIFLDGPGGSLREAVHVVPAGVRVRPENALESPDVSESEATEPFRLVNLDALVRMKLTSFRDKDRMHLRDMIELGLVDAGWVERIPEVLRPRLRELLEHPEG
jgi:hypothetical protein